MYMYIYIYIHRLPGIRYRRGDRCPPLLQRSGSHAPEAVTGAPSPNRDRISHYPKSNTGGERYLLLLQRSGPHAPEAVTGAPSPNSDENSDSDRDQMPGEGVEGERERERDRERGVGEGGYPNRESVFLIGQGHTLAKRQ